MTFNFFERECKSMQGWGTPISLSHPRTVMHIIRDYFNDIALSVYFYACSLSCGGNFGNISHAARLDVHSACPLSHGVLAELITPRWAWCILFMADERYPTLRSDGFHDLFANVVSPTAQETFDLYDRPCLSPFSFRLRDVRKHGMRFQLVDFLFQHDWLGKYPASLRRSDTNFLNSLAHVLPL